eukprot:5106402-Pyramimonas_sp.AAC.1
MEALHDAVDKVRSKGLSLPEPPAGVRDVAQVAALTPGEEYILDTCALGSTSLLYMKSGVDTINHQQRGSDTCGCAVDVSRIHKVEMGLGWEAGCDVGASCGMLDADKSLVDNVCFKKS